MIALNFKFAYQHACWKPPNRLFRLFTNKKCLLYKQIVWSLTRSHWRGLTVPQMPVLLEVQSTVNLTVPQTAPIGFHLPIPVTVIIKCFLGCKVTLPVACFQLPNTGRKYHTTIHKYIFFCDKPEEPTYFLKKGARFAPVRNCYGIPWQTLFVWTLSLLIVLRTQKSNILQLTIDIFGMMTYYTPLVDCLSTSSLSTHCTCSLINQSINHFMYYPPLWNTVGQCKEDAHSLLS